jgi:pimeloyl-ACP methyl ester carboxylesterase
MTGLAFSVREPERIHKLVVMNTSPYEETPLLLHLFLMAFRSKWLTRFFLNRFVFGRYYKKKGIFNLSLVTREFISRYRSLRVSSESELSAFLKPFQRLRKEWLNLLRIFRQSILKH